MPETIQNKEIDNSKSRTVVISICSGKGGVGKSVITANLANILSKSLKVLVWDADLRYPNQHLIMGVEPQVRLKDVYSSTFPLSSALFKVNDNLTLLADHPAQDDFMDFDPLNMQSVYDSLIQSNEFDLILIDTPAGASIELYQCCALSDLINIVVTDEPTSLIDAYGLLKVLLGFVESDKINMLVNNVIDLEDADDISNKLNMATKNFLDISLDLSGFVPYDRLVRQSIIKQELFTDLENNSELSNSIKNIANKFIEYIKNFKNISK